MSDSLYSCGVIYRIKNTNEFLVGRVTGARNGGRYLWSIPKGVNEEGENYSTTAVREMKEETSIVLQESKLVFLTNQLYLPTYNKYLVIFEYQVEAEEAINIKNMKCTSFFQLNGGINIPEMNSFKYIDINKADYYLNRRMYNIIKDLKIWN